MGEMVRRGEGRGFGIMIEFVLHCIASVWFGLGLGLEISSHAYE